MTIAVALNPHGIGRLQRRWSCNARVFDVTARTVAYGMAEPTPHPWVRSRQLSGLCCGLLHWCDRLVAQCSTVETDDTTAPLQLLPACHAFAFTAVCSKMDCNRAIRRHKDRSPAAPPSAADCCAASHCSCCFAGSALECCDSSDSPAGRASKDQNKTSILRQTSGSLICQSRPLSCASHSACCCRRVCPLLTLLSCGLPRHVVDIAPRAA